MAVSASAEIATQSGDDFDTVAGDPAGYYADPQGVVADDTLGRDQKLRLLREWAMDLDARLMADSEGMMPHDETRPSPDAATMRRVKDAIAAVETTPDQAAAPPRTLWQRITGG
jgi:hypothetical protein